MASAMPVRDHERGPQVVAPAGQPAGQPAAWLAGRAGGPLAGHRFLLSEPGNVLGRAPDCQVALPPDDVLASRHHAEVRREGFRYVLRDLGSLNGTFVNGARVTASHALVDGDEVLVGSTVLRFTDPSATVRVPEAVVLATHRPVWLDERTGEAFARGCRLRLTPKEFTLLQLLVRRPGDVVTKDEIAQAVWPEYQGAVSDYNIETLVSRVRHKLAAAGAAAGEGQTTLKAVRARGYRLRVEHADQEYRSAEREAEREAERK